MAIFTDGVTIRGTFQGTGITSLNLPNKVVSRSHLESTEKTIAIPLDSIKKASDYLHLPASAGGDFALTAGTFGTNGPKIQGQSASGASVTDNARVMIGMPPEYEDGTNITVRVAARVTAAANTSATIDVEAHEMDRNGSVGSALVSASTQDINSTSWADKDFTVDGTNLVSGDMIDLQLTSVVDDTGASTGSVAEIGIVELLMNVQG